MYVDPATASATAGYVAATETAAAAASASTASALLLSARRKVGIVFFIELVCLLFAAIALGTPWFKLTITATMAGTTITTTETLWPNNKVVVCPPGSSCTTYAFSDAAVSSTEQSSLLVGASRAALAFTALTFILLIFILVTLFGVWRRVKVAAASVSLAPLTGVPVHFAWSLRPFTPVYTMWAVGTCSVLAWVVYLAGISRWINANLPSTLSPDTTVSKSFYGGFGLVVTLMVFNGIASWLAFMAARTVVAAEATTRHAGDHANAAATAYAVAATYAPPGETVYVSMPASASGAPY